MTNPLENLLKRKQAAPPSKRHYFQRNQSLIFRLLEAGATHAEILEAFEQDGVKMSGRYFSRLLNESKPENSSLKNATQEKESFKSPVAKNDNPANADHVAKKELKQTYEKIKNRNDITDKEKRELMAQAAKEYASNNSPFNRI